MGKKFVGLGGLKHFWTKAKTWIAGQITAEVTAKIAELVANAPEDLDTLKEIADWISTHANDASAMNTQINTNKNDIAALQTSVAGKAAVSHTHDDRYFTETEITSKLAGKSDKGHTHTRSQIIDFAHIHNKSQIVDFAHTHDDRYYTESEVDTELSRKADTGHTHTKSQITDFAHTHDDRYYTESEVDTELSRKADTGHTHTKSQITDFAHTHDDRYYTETEVDTKLSGKSDTGHTHTKSQITDFPTSLPANGGTADRATGIDYTGESGGCISAQQTPESYNNSDANWASYIICNHGNGETYYHQMLRLPFFSDTIQLQRRVNGELQGWKNVAIMENENTWSGRQNFTTAKASNKMVIPIGAPSQLEDGCIWIQ